MLGSSSAIAAEALTVIPSHPSLEVQTLKLTHPGHADELSRQEISVSHLTQSLNLYGHNQPSAAAEITTQKQIGKQATQSPTPNSQSSITSLPNEQPSLATHMAPEIDSFQMERVSPPRSQAAILDPAISNSAADLGDILVGQTPPPTPDLPPTPTPPQQAPTPAKPEASHSLNIWVFRALRKPVGNRVLDTGVTSAGIFPKDRSERLWSRDFLTGNWGGIRDEWYAKGIDIYLVHAADVYGVVSGGRQQDTAYRATTVFGLDLYTSKLGWWKEGQIHLTLADLEGPRISTQYAGSLNTVIFSEPVENGPRLFELWYGQKFANNTVEVRFGRIYPFVRIASSQPAGIFTNTSFQYPNFLGTTPRNGLTASFPVAPFGLQVSYSPSPEWFLIGQVQEGFNDPSGGTDNRTGLSIGLSREEGVEGILEAGYRLNQRPGSTGLPGNYKLGFQFHTGQFLDKTKTTASGEPREDWGNYAAYFIAEQMLWRESPNPKDRTQGLTGFLKTVYAPKDNINDVTFNVAAGLDYEGLIPGRDRDVFGIGVSYTQLSEGQRKASRASLRADPTNPNGLVIQDSGEAVIEMLYAAEIAPWWVIIGSVQHIINPSGSSDRSDATVVGISNRISF